MIDPTRPRAATAQREVHSAPGIPFDTAEQALFWFVQAFEARNAGARVRAGMGEVPRPCEPLDIFRILDRLHRTRRLGIDHLKVMAHYARRLSRPDPGRQREARAAMLWDEGLARLEGALQAKGLVRDALAAAA